MDVILRKCCNTRRLGVPGDTAEDTFNLATPRERRADKRQKVKAEAEKAREAEASSSAQELSKSSAEASSSVEPAEAANKPLARGRVRRRAGDVEVIGAVSVRGKIEGQIFPDGTSGTNQPRPIC